jgi:hypothetical protein
MLLSEQNDDEEIEDESPEPDRPWYQFGISTLLYLMTGTAVLCSMIAWLGLLPVLLVLSIAGGTFLGLLFCSYLGLGFAFEDLPWDIAKCFIIAVIAIIPGALLAYMEFELFPVRACVILSGLAYCFSFKFAWLDIENPEILICSLVALFVMAITIVAFMPLLKA